LWPFFRCNTEYIRKQKTKKKRGEKRKTTKKESAEAALIAKKKTCWCVCVCGRVWLKRGTVN
jgi:hypothetical protein